MRVEGAAFELRKKFWPKDLHESRRDDEIRRMRGRSLGECRIPCAAVGIVREPHPKRRQRRGGGGGGRGSRTRNVGSDASAAMSAAGQSRSSPTATTRAG